MSERAGKAKAVVMSEIADYVNNPVGRASPKVFQVHEVHVIPESHYSDDQ